jgi:hypothetical protein
MAATEHRSRLGRMGDSKQPSEGLEASADRSTDGEERARLERIDRLMEEFWDMTAEVNATFRRWEAEGILSPERPRDRI